MTSSNYVFEAVFIFWKLTIDFLINKFLLGEWRLSKKVIKFCHLIVYYINFVKKTSLLDFIDFIFKNRKNFFRLIGTSTIVP